MPFPNDIEGYPRFHPSDVKAYIAWGALGVIGLIVLAEVFFALFGKCQTLEENLKLFGAFDAGFLTLASSIIFYYFGNGHGPK